MEEWKEYRLGDLIELNNGFAFKSKDFIQNGIPVIKIKNVKPNRILLEDLSFVSVETAQHKKCVKILPTDILITMTGNRKDGGSDSWVGKVALFKKEGKYLLNQRVSAIKVKRHDIINYKYLAYLLSSWESQLYFINNSNSSGGQANISPEIVNNYIIYIPSLYIQNSISNILSSLDDKIELNRRINENLEQQAQALFKSWFVDFEPFKGGKFVDSELGMIPEGWRINLVKDIAIFTQGTQVPVSMQYNTQKENMIRFIRIVDYTSNNTELPRFIYKTNKQTECDESDVIMVRYGNIGTIGRRLTGVIANNLFKISPSNILTKNFLYYFFKQKEIQELIVASAAGSAMPAIKHSTIGNINIIVPPKGVVNMFDLICNSYEAQILKNNQENSYLKEVRDTLLPKLMSGELAITDVDDRSIFQ